MGRLKAAGAEVIQVTPTKPERARFYVKNFPIPFPYLCDPDLTVHREWGLGVRSHSLLWYLQKFQAGSKMTMPEAEIGTPKTTSTELPSVLRDTDSAVFVLDRQGVVRYRNSGAYMSEHGLRDDAEPGRDPAPAPGSAGVMTITVYGAGAIGGITGARLAQAGHDVLLVDKAADHVAAMNAGGLTIESRQSAVTIPGPRHHARAGWARASSWSSSR